MAGVLTIDQGGRIRANFPTDSSSTWSRGSIVALSPTGTLKPYAGEGNVLCGVALENCVTSAAGNPKNDSNVVVQGATGSVLLGEALVTTDALSGTGGWIAGVSQVYAQSGGLLTNTVSSGVTMLVGQATSNPAANGRLQFLFRPKLTVA